MTLRFFVILFRMLYVFYGTDTARLSYARDTLVKNLLVETPETSVHHIEGENFSIEECERLLVSQGLFSPSIIVILQSFLENEKARSFLEKNIKNIASSHILFVVQEKELPKALLTKCEKYSESVSHFSIHESKKYAFNSFQLTDAVGKRDKRNAWLLLIKALREGKSAEEVQGLLFWQIKTMLLVKRARDNTTSSELGIKPFVFQKTHAFCENYTLEELCARSKMLVALYHEARMGGETLPLALERFVLTL
jgi:DNA polymerase III delta subunit